MHLLEVGTDEITIDERTSLLGQVRSTGAVRRLSTDDARVHSDLDGLVPAGLGNGTDATLRWPDQAVDLIHLPELVALPEDGRVGQHDVGASFHVVAAVLPTLVGSGQELNGDVLVAFLGQP